MTLQISLVLCGLFSRCLVCHQAWWRTCSSTAAAAWPNAGPALGAILSWVARRSAFRPTDRLSRAEEAIQVTLQQRGTNRGNHNLRKLPRFQESQLSLTEATVERSTASEDAFRQNNYNRTIKKAWPSRSGSVKFSTRKKKPSRQMSLRRLFGCVSIEMRCGRP